MRAGESNAVRFQKTEMRESRATPLKKEEKQQTPPNELMDTENRLVVVRGGKWDYRWEM